MENLTSGEIEVLARVDVEPHGRWSDELEIEVFVLLTCGAIVVLGLWIGIVWVALAGCLAFATYRVWYVRQQARGLQHLRTALRKLKVIPLKYATETGEPETPGPDGVDR